MAQNYSDPLGFQMGSIAWPVKPVSTSEWGSTGNTLLFFFFFLILIVTQLWFMRITEFPVLIWPTSMNLPSFGQHIRLML